MFHLTIRHVTDESWFFFQTLHLIGPAHEIMALFVLRKCILQTRMRYHPVGLDVWFLVGPFVYFHTLCLRTAKALARLRGCAGSLEPSLVACDKNHISCAGSIVSIILAIGCWFFNLWAALWQNQQSGMYAQRRLRSAWPSWSVFAVRSIFS